MKDFVVSAEHRVKITESEKRDTYLDLARELKKTEEHEDDDDTNYNWGAWQGPKGLGSGATRVWIWKKNRDPPNYNIIEIVQNTEKSSEDLRRRVVTQTLVKDHQLTLVWKICML